MKLISCRSPLKEAPLSGVLLFILLIAADRIYNLGRVNF